MRSIDLLNCNNGYYRNSSHPGLDSSSLDVANKKAASLSECRLLTSGQWPSTTQ
jgi:hypothetical protein